MNFFLFLCEPAYYRTIEVALTRIPIFLLGSYYAEQIQKKGSLKFFYIYGVAGFILYIFSFIILLEPDWENLSRRYFAGGFVIIVMCVMVYLLSKSGNKHSILDFFGDISLEVYLFSSIRSILTRLGIGNNSGILVKWCIVFITCVCIVLASRIFSRLYNRYSVDIENKLRRKKA